MGFSTVLSLAGLLRDPASRDIFAWQFPLNPTGTHQFLSRKDEIFQISRSLFTDPENGNCPSKVVQNPREIFIYNVVSNFWKIDVLSVTAVKYISSIKEVLRSERGKKGILWLCSFEKVIALNHQVEQLKYSTPRMGQPFFKAWSCGKL